MEVREKVLPSREEYDAAEKRAQENSQDFYLDNGEIVSVPDMSDYYYLDALERAARTDPKVLGLDTLSDAVAQVVRKMTHDGWKVLSREYQMRNFKFFDDVPPHWPASEGYKEDPADALSEVATMIVLQNEEKTRYDVIMDNDSGKPGIISLSVSDVERMFDMSRNVKKSKFDKEKIIRLRKLGKSFSEIEEEVGCQRSFAVRVCKAAKIVRGKLRMKDKTVKIVTRDGHVFECKKPGRLSIKTPNGWTTACTVWDTDAFGEPQGMLLVWNETDQLTGDLTGAEVISQGTYRKCEKCEGTGKIKNPVWEEEFENLVEYGDLDEEECRATAGRYASEYIDCDVCAGIGYVAE